MACDCPNRDRHIVIAFSPTSRKAVYLRAGDPPATAPPTHFPLSPTTEAAVSPFLTVRPPAPDPTSHSNPTAESLLPSFPANVNAPKSP